MGMGRRMGPLDLMHVQDRTDNRDLMLGGGTGPSQAMYYQATDMSTEQV